MRICKKSPELGLFESFLICFFLSLPQKRLGKLNGETVEGDTDAASCRLQGML